MSQLLAIEFSGDEARLVVASGRGDRVVIEQALAVPVQMSAGDEKTAPVPDWGATLAAAIGAHHLGHNDVLVAVGRGSVELRQLSLPPAPDEELPELVQFQAMREFNQLDEDWLLDFVPADAGGDGPRTVLAAALGPELAGQLRQACESAGLKLRRLVLRPCAAAALVLRNRSADISGLRLLVDLFSDDVDLTAILDGRVVFLRTARLPGDPVRDASAAAALLGEVRRTVAAVQNQCGGRQIDGLVFFGTRDVHQRLVEQTAAAFDRPAELFDPFAGLRLGSGLRGALPERPARFAPLLGTLLAEFTQAGHAIDFLNPRRPPKPPSRHWRYGAAAAALVLLVAGYFGFSYLQRQWLEDDVRRLDEQLKVATARAAEAKVLEDKVREIEKWTATNINWLDEFYALSENFPPAKQVMLKNLIFGPTARGGEIKFEGLADTEAITQVGERARDPRHQVTITGSGKNTADKSHSGNYGWTFTASVKVSPEKKQ